MYTIKDRVCVSRTDASGIMKLTGALDIIQDCSVLWLESEPSFQNFLTCSKLGLYAVSRQADIVRLPVYGERITIQTSVFECRSFLAHRNTVLYGEDGLPCILSWSIGAIVNTQTEKMARLPQNEIDLLSIDDKIDMDYLDKKIVLPIIEGQYMDAVKVKRNDIDMNRHMNNAKYIEAALELLPSDFPVKRLRIEYKKPAKLGELLYPKVLSAPSGQWHILMLNSMDNIYAIIEFS